MRKENKLLILAGVISTVTSAIAVVTYHFIRKDMEELQHEKSEFYKMGFHENLSKTFCLMCNKYNEFSEKYNINVHPDITDDFEYAKDIYAHTFEWSDCDQFKFANDLCDSVINKMNRWSMAHSCRENEKQ